MEGKEGKEYQKTSNENGCEKNPKIRQNFNIIDKKWLIKMQH